MSHAPLVGLVGCGRWGRLILRDLLSLGCRVHVAAPSGATAGIAREAGAASVVERAGDLPDVAGLVVASPTATHAEMVEALLPRGVPIFVEKPLCTDGAAAARIAQAGAGRVFVMDKWRYHPGVLALAALARSGNLGPVLGLETLRVQKGCPHVDVDPVWILAPHDLSIAQEILGSIPAPVSAVAEGEGTWMEGLSARMGTDPWFSFEVSSRRAESRREVRLHCRDGTAVLDDAYADHLAILRGPAPGVPGQDARPLPATMPLRSELEAFVAHLGGGPPPRTPVAEAARAVLALEALRRLARGE